ncbi:hypothetical protein O9Z70_11875 [Devosia sp. YIM 151766]|uniref:hypothetical protein n=1 Tax=Devosia sp. YIM 151766 TaxID=3017325 RepID=UPI00255CC254|nr:hypothetical protein [Devosia sp. YIM 151766]WIY52159.1 hypothetical protein O9Z70_11875 [Devosia sp. YIM 151766]
MSYRAKPLLFVAILAGLSAPAFSAEFQRDIDAGHSFWGVGRTGVMCYMAPCPWQGIFPISADKNERGFPIARQNQPEPRFTSADPAVTRAVIAAYAKGDCLIVEGKRIGDGLDIARIIGQC